MIRDRREASPDASKQGNEDYQASVVPLVTILAVGADTIRRLVSACIRADNIRPYGFLR